MLADRMRKDQWKRGSQWLGGAAVAVALALAIPVSASWSDEAGLLLRLRPDAPVGQPEAPAPPRASLTFPVADIPSGEDLIPAPPERPFPAGPAMLAEPPGDRPPLEATLDPPGVSVPTYPVVINAPVEALIDHFAARDRERFSLWIARSGRYLDMIRKVFRERGLPEELAYTAMIESGFNPRAVSRVGAKGMWQFMEATARRYGLVVNRWVDERLDPVKSTAAAARYLGDLHGMFGHWFLAQAGYNAGEARVARAIQLAKTNDFWALTQTRYLPDETKLFVPQILAATVIGREPARYGFDVAREAPLAFEEVTVRRSMDFESVARLAGVAANEIRELNPALLGRITPPFGSYALRLPVGAGERLEAALRGGETAGVPQWGIHRVTRAQSLADVARLYQTTPQRLAEVNHLPGGRLRGITELVVPVSRAASPAPEEHRRPMAVAASAPAPAHGAGPAVASQGASGKAREVVVRRGDTLGGIANRHGIATETLARWNGLEAKGLLPAGARLRLTAP